MFACNNFYAVVRKNVVVISFTTVLQITTDFDSFCTQLTRNELCTS